VGGAEYMVRGRGYVRTVATSRRSSSGRRPGRPVLVRDVGSVALGPEMRRGVTDLDGEGDAVGGIVVMRHGENALNVIRRVKAALHEIKPVAAGRASRWSPPTTART
jgi:Cu(I)/Ag(I) efflux system membrane protein CusA/SilA